MFTVSPLQAIDVWEELMRCLYGDNNYGSTVSEIYLYKLMSYSPLVAARPNSEEAKEAYIEANKALHALCKLFEERHEVTLYLFDGPMESGFQTGPLPLDELLSDEPWTHRVHVGLLEKETV